jgi:hypothetical protein
VHVPRPPIRLADAAKSAGRGPDAVQRKTTNDALDQQLIPVQLSTGRPEAAQSAYRVLAARGPAPADGGPTRDAVHLDLIGK